MQSAIHRAAETPLQTRLREELKLRRARMAIVRRCEPETVPSIPDGNTAQKPQQEILSPDAAWCKRQIELNRVPPPEREPDADPVVDYGIPVPRIVTAVAKHYGMTPTELVAQRRTKDIVRPRQVAMYLAKKLTTRSLPRIGRHFCDRDHTTILHSVRKIELLLETDEALAADIAAIKAVLE